MKAQIEIKNIYGNETVYPVNDTAKLLCEMAGTKTFTPKTISVARKLGYEFEVIQSSINALKACFDQAI